MARVVFLWDSRPGANIDHIAAHGVTTDLWQEVFHRATLHASDKDEPALTVAEGRARNRLYRIVYGVEDEAVIPVTIIPITGFPIKRRGLHVRRSP